MNAFGYAHEDRIWLEPAEGTSQGIEVYLKNDTGGKFSWWCNYGLAVAEDKIDNAWIPRYHDQRQTIYFDLNYRPNRKNIREYNYYHGGLKNGSTIVGRSDVESWLPVMPSFGVIWEF